jgi:endonuclease YncB( thermonuclease family)
LALISVLVAAAGALAVAATASRHSSTTTGTVVGVPTADTLVVHLPKKGKTKARNVRVRVLGISAPTGASCYATQATAAARQLALGKTVTLAGYLTQRVYVSLPGGVDFGQSLVQSGAVQTDVWSAPFSRLADYVPLEHAAETGDVGMWGACAADVQTAASGPTTGAPGDYLTYSASVTNSGPLTAQGIHVELRPGSYGKTLTKVTSTMGDCTAKTWVAYCEISSLAPGSSASFSVTIRATQPGALTARIAATLTGCTDQQCGTSALQDSNLDNDRAAAVTIVPGGSYGLPGHTCDAAYPTVCLPPPPVDLDCADFAPLRNFPVDASAPNGDDHHLDGNGDGIACEGDDY